MSRLATIKVFFNLLFAVLLLSLLSLLLTQGEKYKELSSRNCVRLLSQPGARGNILDREGNVIVDNKLSYDVLIMPQGRSTEVDEALTGVARILGVSLKSVRDAYRNSYLAPSVPVKVAGNITVKEAIALEQEKLTMPSIIIQSRPLRHYPFGSLAAHVIGYVSEIDQWRLDKLADYGYKTKDQVGFGGLEEKYDYYLRQGEGGLSVEVDHRGRFVRVLGFKQPHNGKDIKLSLNLKIQKIAEEALGGRKGSVVMMDPSTGEIIAMASSPSFDPSSFTEQNNAEISSYLSDIDSPLINRAISSAYPAGSVFKVIVAAAGLETKKLNPFTSWVCQGSINIGKQKFKCWETHGRQDLVQAIANSCNVFFYHSGLLISAKVLHDYARKFGLSRTTAFELPYEEAGFIPSPLWRKLNKFKNWYDGDTANLSIGQGDVLVTSLQMARVMAVFANNGYLVTPYIVKGVDNKDISSYQQKITDLRLKQQTIDYIRQGLRNVVTTPTGTGSVLSALAVPVAGKTGTAQAPPGQPHAWFIGYFPFKEPKFVICVFLERGGPGYFSCLTAKQIIERMLMEGLL